MTRLRDTQKDLRARALANNRFRNRAARIDETQCYPQDNVQDMVKAGFMGMTLPTTYGGWGYPIWIRFWWSKKLPGCAP